MTRKILHTECSKILGARTVTRKILHTDCPKILGARTVTRKILHTECPKILGARTVTRKILHTECPKILLTTVAISSWRPGARDVCTAALRFFNYFPSSLSLGDSNSISRLAFILCNLLCYVRVLT